jgi:hypothetical protein
MSDSDFEFAFDLSAHEMRRRAEVIKALGPDWDPIAVLQGESEAYALLYSGLDAQEQAVYQQLVDAGVLPQPGVRRDAA